MVVLTDRQERQRDRAMTDLMSETESAHTHTHTHVSKVGQGD